MSKKKKRTSQNSMFVKVLKLLGSRWGSIVAIIGILGCGYEAGCICEGNRLRLDHIRIENTAQKEQMQELHALQEKVLNLEADLRDCEQERRRNESRKDIKP